MRFPIVDRCGAVMVGGGLNAMEQAIRLSETKDVLLVTEDTFLYAEMVRSGDYRLPENLTPLQRDVLLPERLRQEDGLFHPDRLKKHGEAVLREKGVRLLYACQVLGQREGFVILAHKSGLYAVSCREAWDAREAPTLARPAYCLHTMREGRHEALLVPGVPGGMDAASRLTRYAQALSRLPQGSTLARSGTAPTDSEGILIPPAVPRPLAAAPTGPCDPARGNPLHGSMESAELEGALGAVSEGAYDVIVAGGGTAGASAAIFAGRCGLKTLVLDMNDRLGGSGTAGGVSTYWFGLRTGATAIIDQAVDRWCKRLSLPRRACLWNEHDTFPPDLKAHALLELCLDAGTEARFGCVVCGVEKTEKAVTGVYWAEGGRLCFARARMLLDSTGDGDLAMFAGAQTFYGSEKDGMTYWASLAQYPTPDGYKNNFSTMVHLGDPRDYTRFILAGRQRGENTYDHGQYVAVRESRHIRGMETVTLRDLFTLRSQPLPLYDCFSNLDPKGRMTADSAYFGLLCPNRRLNVPRGAVIPVDEEGRPMAGLLVGGKAISCTHDAFPLLRMQPDLQRQGLALAALSACALEQGKPAWAAERVKEKILGLGGDLPGGPEAPALPALQDVVAALRGDEPWEWLDAPPDTWEGGVSPIIQIFAAPSDAALPLLRAAWESAPAGSEKQLTLARLLLWHGDERGAPCVMARVGRLLDAYPGLPPRQASINYGQLLPDHGLMPEAVYLLNSLSRTREAPVLPLFQRVMDRLEASPRNWRDIRAGVYCYVECFAYVARGRRDPAFTPLLFRALRLPEFGREAPDELMRERLDMLCVILLGALHALGEEAGAKGLRQYAADDRLPFRLAAQMLLDAPD